MPLVGASGTVWGTALVPKEGGGKTAGVVTSPVFVSIGHRVSLETCVALTKAVGRCAFFFCDWHAWSSRMPSPLGGSQTPSGTYLPVLRLFTCFSQPAGGRSKAT